MQSDVQNLYRSVPKIKKILSDNNIAQHKEVFKWVSNFLCMIVRYGYITNQYIHTLIQQIQSNIIMHYYSKKLPYFLYLVHRYEKLYSLKIIPVEDYQIINQKIQQNFHHLNCYGQNDDLVSIRQKQVMENQKINQYLLQISTNQIIINNSDCVRCCPVFVKDFQVRNNNPCLPNLIALTDKQGFDRVSLQRYIIAVLNSGGGVILVGAQSKNNIIKTTGINFKDQVQRTQRLKQINQSLKNIKPQCFITLQCIFVHNNFMQTKSKSILQQKYRFIFRFTIIPFPSKSYYLEINIKGFQTKYQIYKLDNKQYKKLVKYTQDNKEQKNTICSLLIQNYYNKFLRQYKHNIHQNVLCHQPYLLNSKSYIEYIQDPSNCNQTPIDDEQIVQIDQGESVFKDQPNFAYGYQTLLTVGTHKHQRSIKQLIPFLTNRKHAFQIIKPFENSFKQSSRSIWMISHQQSFSIIKNVIKQHDKGGHITILPVHHTLQIQKSKFSQYNQKIIQKRFRQRYPGGYRTQWKNMIDVNNSVLMIADLIFNNYTHAIYAYLLFEELKLWPYFVQDHTNYKKKPKKAPNQK